MPQIIIIGSSLLGLLLLVFITAYICFRMVFYSKPRTEEHLSRIRLPKGEEYAPYREEMRKWIEDARTLPYEPMEIRSHDGFTLRGRYYEKIAGAPIEIQFHGYRGDSDRDLSGAIYRAFAVGRNALIVDHRGSGRSEGNVITFGILERRDCLLWVEHAIRRFGDNVELHLTGISMGAATVLMAAGEPLPANVKGVLADCPYSSARAIIQKVMRDRHIPVPILYPFVRLGARIFGHFRLEETSPIQAVGRAQVPIILYHGEGDTFVPCDMSREIYAACRSPKKKLITVPKAPHGMAYSQDKEYYLKTLKKFIEKIS